MQRPNLQLILHYDLLIQTCLYMSMLKKTCMYVYLVHVHCTHTNALAHRHVHVVYERPERLESANIPRLILLQKPSLSISLEGLQFGFYMHEKEDFPLIFFVLSLNFINHRPSWVSSGTCLTGVAQI